MKKYELIPLDKYHTFYGTGVNYQIRALKSFSDVDKGDLGGYVNNESNLSQSGDCWIYDEGQVLDKAKVKDNAIVCDKAKARDNSVIQDNATIRDNALIQDNVIVQDNGFVCDSATIEDNAVIEGHGFVGDYEVVDGYDVITGHVILSRNRRWGDIN